MLLDMFNPINEGYVSKLCLSDDFAISVREINTDISKKIIYFDDDFEICHVKLSNKIGFVKVLPSSKYHLLLNKYIKLKKIKDPYFFNKNRDNFNDFEYGDDFKDKIEKNYQNMRIGRFIRRLFGDGLHGKDVEEFVNKFKNYQSSL